MSLFNKIKDKIFNTKKEKYLNNFSSNSNSFGQKLKFITSKSNVKNDNEFLEQLMVTLIEADLGYNTSKKICDIFYENAKKYPFLSSYDIKLLLKETFLEIYNISLNDRIIYNQNGPTVILLIGVNGSGKTSTCAKLANMFLKQGKKVALVAADTFRAGAVDQLKTWANRLEIDCIAGKENQDPSSVIHMGCTFAKENNIDILICDSAGRLQNKINLMQELAKMNKVISNLIENAPHNTWLVIDSNTGQNGISQAQLFNEITKLNGIILTKTDGTSKGGIVISIKNEIGKEVKFITCGETIDDIFEFDFDLFLYSIIGDLNESL